MVTLEAVGLADVCVVAASRGSAIRLGRCTGSQATFLLSNRAGFDQYSIQVGAGTSSESCWRAAYRGTGVTSEACPSVVGAHYEWLLVAEPRETE